MYRPKLGETYYSIYMGSDFVVTDYEWASDSIDEGHYLIGNVFRTEHEAEDKLNEIKQILKQQ